MKAMVYEKYGPPEVLHLKEVEKPVPKDNEVLIKIHASTVTAYECAARQGKPFLVRFGLGLFKPKKPILGVEMSGEIESVGRDVKRFKAGDQVFGYCGSGAHAEYRCMPEDGQLAMKPTNMTFEQAAPACDGALTALPFIREKGKVQSGQKVLINGASGSIGTFAVQIARYYGAEVTGVCSTSNQELVKSIGADHVVDYTKEDFTRSGKTYDVIFDTVAKSSFSRSKRALKQNGLYLTTFPNLRALLPNIGSKKAIFHAAGMRKPEIRAKDLNFIKGLIEAGKLESVIDRRYPLEKLPDAFRHVETGHKKGNVVITMEEST